MELFHEKFRKPSAPPVAKTSSSSSKKLKGKGKKSSKAYPTPDVASVSQARSMYPSDTESASSLSAELKEILRYDQLNQERRIHGNSFRGFEEGQIMFPPTFKYDKGADCFDSSAKARCPAWTDRILFYSNAVSAHQINSSSVSSSNSSINSSNSLDYLASMRIKSDALLCLDDYYSIDARSSDHRPVCAIFSWRG